MGSFITTWCRNAIENFEIEPKNILISLLNDLHVPLTTWHVFNAYPVKVAISEFNAEQNSLVIETLELSYQYYKTVGLDSMIGGAVGAAAGAVSGGLSGSVSF